MSDGKTESKIAGGGTLLGGDRSELFTACADVAIAAVETFPMPGLVAKRDSAGHNNLFALGASGGVLVLVANDTLIGGLAR